MATDARTQPQADDGCVPNIGPLERRKRLRLGIQISVASAAFAVALFAFGAPRAARLLLLPPLLGAAICFFQVRAKTCVRLAAHDVRNLDAGDEPITDPAERAQIRRQARRVYIESFLVAAAVTALVAAVPR